MVKAAFGAVGGATAEAATTETEQPEGPVSKLGVAVAVVGFIADCLL